jgi:hypothetical protein
MRRVFAGRSEPEQGSRRFSCCSNGGDPKWLEAVPYAFFNAEHLRRILAKYDANAVDGAACAAAGR